MEKEWCVYKYIWPANFAKVTKDNGDVFWLRYSEGQLFDDQPWDAKYVLRFDKLIEALEYLSKFSNQSLRRLKELAEDRFPGVLEREERDGGKIPRTEERG